MRPFVSTALALVLTASSAAAEPGAPHDIVSPPPPEVNDPMLAPVPRAQTEIATWEQALQFVRARSTDLRIAAASITRAQAQHRVALGGALPSLTGQAAFTHQWLTNDVVSPATGATVTTPTPNVLTGQLVAMQPLLALRSWNAIGTANVAEEAARLSFEDAKRQISLAVANAIVGVVTAERIAELNRSGLRNALARLELTVRKSNLGGATGLDVVRAKQDVEVARATLVTGDETLRQSRETLGLTLGTSTGTGVSPTIDISGLERDARTICKPGKSVDERPDIAALRTRVDLAHRAVKDAKTQFAPTINLQSALSSTSVDTGLAPRTTWNIQAVLSVPIWEGGVRYGTLRDAHTQEDIAALNLEASRRSASVQVTQAERAITVADDSRRVANASRDLAAETDRLTRLAYQEGRGTSLELVTAAQALRESEIQLALRDFQVVKARVAAVLALASCPW
jgi:outer membrane protein TolC